MVLSLKMRLMILIKFFEESPLQLFDYFPKVKLDSKVDIEVETITKFEDASVTGFIIENTW